MTEQEVRDTLKYIEAKIAQAWMDIGNKHYEYATFQFEDVITELKILEREVNDKARLDKKESEN